RRPVGQIREVTMALSELTDASSPYGRTGSSWRQVRDAMAALNRELGVRAVPEAPVPPGEAPIVGRVEWRGSVDDRVHLVIRGRSVETRTVSGATKPAGTATFTSGLPNRPVDVGVTKTRGRGD